MRVSIKGKITSKGLKKMVSKKNVMRQVHWL